MIPEIYKVLASWILILFPLASWSGGVVGNGADKVDGRVAWFSDQRRTIAYCMEVDPVLASKREAFQRIFEKTVSLWSTHYQHRVVSSLRPPPEQQLSFNFVGGGPCLGGEDFRILIGGRHDEVEKVKRLYVDPNSFVHLIDYDRATKWGRGFIWIDEGVARLLDSPIPSLIFLHEMGHVFGCDHVEGTAMDPKYVSHSFSGHPEAIDGLRFLLPPDFSEDVIVPGSSGLNLRELGGRLVEMGFSQVIPVSISRIEFRGRKVGVNLLRVYHGDNFVDLPFRRRAQVAQLESGEAVFGHHRQSAVVDHFELKSGEKQYSFFGTWNGQLSRFTMTDEVGHPFFY